MTAKDGERGRLLARIAALEAKLAAGKRIRDAARSVVRYGPQPDPANLNHWPLRALHEQFLIDAPEEIRQTPSPDSPRRSCMSCGQPLDPDKQSDYCDSGCQYEREPWQYSDIEDPYNDPGHRDRLAEQLRRQQEGRR